MINSNWWRHNWFWTTERQKNKSNQNIASHPVVYLRSYHSNT